MLAFLSIATYSFAILCASQRNQIPELAGGHDGISLLQRESQLLRPRQAVLEDRESAAGPKGGERHGTLLKLWQGLELTEREIGAIAKQETHQQMEAVGRVKSILTQKTAASTKKLHILGPPDTGTNLIELTLELNWPDLLQNACACHPDDSTRAKGVEREKKLPKPDRQEWAPKQCDCALWKHSIGNATDLVNRMRTCQDQDCETRSAPEDNTVVIIMVRSPIAQMIAWHTHAYSLSPCFERPFAEFTSPCFANTSPDWHDSTEGCNYTVKYDKSIQFKSSADVYNAYMRQYRDLQTQFGKAVLIVPFEELVISTSPVLERVAKAMDWPMPEKIKVFDRPSKGDGIQRAEALERLDWRSHLQDLNANDLDAMCSGIDESLLKGLYENPDPAQPRPYTYDCQHFVH
mmetsp:Transcript_17786/g.33007  ORF Transcript_17786/g.33007 Transcript_17786/m.33007 type:complete len:406 (-) Transcript_17786:212-1429(-)